MSTATPLPKIACPHCQGTMKSPGLPAGSKVNCPKCGKPFVLGGGAPAPQASGGRKPSEQPASGDLRGLTPPAAPPADALSAAAATQPAHRPPRPDMLVDPTMVPPPKPKPKPKPTEVAVVCRLCGTRMHAPIAAAGQTLRCPDCHTVNE